MKKVKFASHRDFKQYKEMMAIMPKSPEEIKKIYASGEWPGWLADGRSKDFSHLDLSEYDPNYFDFDTLTIWPTKDKMPKGFNPEEVMENMKDPGLGIRALHKLGLTGKGLNMAIIDDRLPDHQEYHDNIIYSEEFGDWSNVEPEGSMHGSAVVSIAVGKTCGVAPDAKVYYFAHQNILYHNEDYSEMKCTYQPVIEAIDKILEINKKLPEKNKIQVISLSWGTASKRHECYDQMQQAVQRCKDAGLFLNSTAQEEHYGLKGHGLNRDIQKDPNKIDSYSETCWFKDFYGKDTLCVPMDHRTTAAPNGYSDYVHYANGAWSWKQPFESALFLLARQVNPQITPEKFWKVGLKTATQKGNLNIINPIKLVNVLSKEMLEKLQNKKSLTEAEKAHIKDLQKWIKGTEIHNSVRKCLKRHTVFLKNKKGEKIR